MRRTDTTCSYYNRYYKSTYGTQAGTWMYNTVVSVAASNPLITVSKFTHSYSQPSVIAKISGTSGSVGTCFPAHATGWYANRFHPKWSFPHTLTPSAVPSVVELQEQMIMLPGLSPF